MLANQIAQQNLELLGHPATRDSYSSQSYVLICYSNKENEWAHFNLHRLNVVQLDTKSVPVLQNEAFNSVELGRLQTTYSQCWVNVGQKMVLIKKRDIFFLSFLIGQADPDWWVWIWTSVGDRTRIILQGKYTYMLVFIRWKSVVTREEEKFFFPQINEDYVRRK